MPWHPASQPHRESVIECQFDWPASARPPSVIKAEFSNVKISQRQDTAQYRVTGLAPRVREVMNAIFTDKGMMEMILMDARVIRRG